MSLIGMHSQLKKNIVNELEIIPDATHVGSYYKSE